MSKPIPHWLVQRPENCYGCRHITSKHYADGTTLYGCKLTPGLVTGCVSAFDDDDEPKSCKEYQGAEGAMPYGT